MSGAVIKSFARPAVRLAGGIDALAAEAAHARASIAARLRAELTDRRTGIAQRGETARAMQARSVREEYLDTLASPAERAAYAAAYVRRLRHAGAIGPRYDHGYW